MRRLACAFLLVAVPSVVAAAAIWFPPETQALLASPWEELVHGRHGDRVYEVGQEQVGETTFVVSARCNIPFVDYLVFLNVHTPTRGLVPHTFDVDDGRWCEVRFVQDADAVHVFSRRTFVGWEYRGHYDLREEAFVPDRRRVSRPDFPLPPP